MARMSDTKEIKKKHTPRLVGGAETGTRVERTRVAVARLRLAKCGTKGVGSLTTSRPCGPTFAHRETERAGLRVAENRAGRVAGSTLRPHTHAQINQDKRRGAKQTTQPRAPTGGNKASNL